MVKGWGCLIWSVLLCTPFAIKIGVENSPIGIKQRKINEGKQALSLALEANLNYKEFKISCGYWSGSELNSKLIIIPLKKDVIQAALHYKAALEDLSQIQTNDMIKKNLNDLLNSDRATFILIVINNDKLKYGEEIISFDSINTNTQLIGKNNKYYKFVDFSPVFSAPLAPGRNHGYLQFENFRKDYSGIINNYSIQFNRYTMRCSDPKTARSQQVAFSFDESQVDYLALIERGLSTDEIKNRYVSTTFESLNITEEDIINLVKFTIKLLAYTSN